jgi:hypothetical protein
MWNIIVLILILPFIGLGIYNIRSLIKKWKANPQHWIDLLVGIMVQVIATGVLIFIFIRYL